MPCVACIYHPKVMGRGHVCRGSADIICKRKPRWQWRLYGTAQHTYKNKVPAYSTPALKSMDRLYYFHLLLIMPTLITSSWVSLPPPVPVYFFPYRKGNSREKLKLLWNCTARLTCKLYWVRLKGVGNHSEARVKKVSTLLECQIIIFFKPACLPCVWQVLEHIY